jgi:restriction system protein
MLPVLRQAASGEVRIGDVVDRLAKELELSPEDAAEILPSGKQTRFANRTHWAKSYLGKAGLVELTGRGKFRISARGRKVLESPPSAINIKFLEQFPEFLAFKKISDDPERLDAGTADLVEASGATPDELMRQAYAALEQEIADELLQRIRAAPPVFFERLVIQLLLAMGYGGSSARAGKALAVGKTGDGGVDGVIDQDALGLDRVYVQAKRYADGNIVGPGAIRDFFGALDSFKAAKGLFITTSTFSSSSIKTAESLSKRIVLIDGPQLSRLMIRFDVGCRIEDTLHIKKIDEEFFE